MKIITQSALAVLFALINSYAIGQCASSSNIYSFNYNGKTYDIVKENKTWNAAAMCAVQKGGILAEINDAAEQSAIYNQLMNNAGINVNSTIAPDGGGGSYVWLGGNDLLTEGAWIWDGDGDNIGTQFWMGTTSGSPVGGLYNNWGNEPDDYFGQDALALSLNGWPLGVAGEWNDVDHTNSLYYVIEYPGIICNPTSSTITEHACMTYTSPSGKVWTLSNTYMDTIMNAGGCDSVITINLNIHTPNSSTISESACMSYTSPSGKIWTVSNTYMDTVPNLGGCDSVITINLTINNPSTSSITETACKTYTSPSGKVWTLSNTYMDTIPNSVGCDSIITINLTINNVSDITTSVMGTSIEANNTNATYVWLDCDNNYSVIAGETGQSYTATSNVNYAVELSENSCTDTSACVAITSIGIDELISNIGFSAYPNPSNGKVLIEFESPIENVQLILSDLQGKELFRQSYRSLLNESIEIEGVDGIYLLSIQTDQEQRTIRLVKEE